MKFFLLFLFFLAAPFVFLPPVKADNKSDYEYQIARYRQHYLEFGVIKKDYLDNPTLDNQQKAILQVKDTIISRELAKTAFAGMLIDSIDLQSANLDSLSPIVNSLVDARYFYSQSAQRSQSIITPQDLTRFSSEYANDTIVKDHSFKLGVVGVKIARSVRIQRSLKASLDDLLPRIPKPYSQSLTSRLDELQNLGNSINGQIESLVAYLFSEKSLQNIDNDNFFEEISIRLQSIKESELQFVNGLIDIDLNYGTT